MTLVSVRGAQSKSSVVKVPAILARAHSAQWDTLWAVMVCLWLESRMCSLKRLVVTFNGPSVWVGDRSSSELMEMSIIICMSAEEDVVAPLIENVTANHLTPDDSMSAARAVPLLICSIGNPGSLYANTLHSAGHTIVQQLAKDLNATQFTKSRQHGNGLFTQVETPVGATWSLWQSTSYMNESGPGVKIAYREWSRHLDQEGKLVIVHDELEKPLGSVALKTNANASAKGHNGLKSIKSVIGNVPFARIGIGIGRPVSREPADVAKYVTRKMTVDEKEKILASLPDVMDSLAQVGSAG